MESIEGIHPFKNKDTDGIDLIRVIAILLITPPEPC
jgi:hypothetical protein